MDGSSQWSKQLENNWMSASQTETNDSHLWLIVLTATVPFSPSPPLFLLVSCIYPPSLSLSFFVCLLKHKAAFPGPATNIVRYCIVIFPSKWRSFVFRTRCIMAWLYNVMCFSVKPRLHNGSPRFFISLSEHFISKPLISHAVCERDTGYSSTLHSHTSVRFFSNQKCKVFRWDIYNVPRCSRWVLCGHNGLFVVHAL